MTMPKRCSIGRRWRSRSGPAGARRRSGRRSRRGLARRRPEVRRDLLALLDRRQEARREAGVARPAHRHSRARGCGRRTSSAPMKESPTGSPRTCAHRHGEVRIAGDRGEAAGRAAAGAGVAMDRVDQPGRRAGRADQGDDIVLAQQPVDPLRRRRAAARSRARCDRPRRGPASPAACSNRSWPNSAISSARMRAVEGDQIGQRARPHGCGQGGEIGVEVVLQFGEQDDDLVAADLLPAAANSAISTSTAPCARSTSSAASNAASVPKPAEKRITPIRTPRSASGRSAGDIIHRAARSASAVAGSAGSAAGDRVHDQGRVAHRQGHRPRRVLAVADRHDMGAADQADAWA